MEQCEDHKTLMKMIVEIRDALLGTYKDKGLISKVTENRQDINDIKDVCSNKTKTKNGLLDWTFRVIITTVLAYIATKVGIK